MNRRDFFLSVGAGALGCGAAHVAAAANGTAGEKSAAGMEAAQRDGYGMLVDTTECIGCRKCEYACAKANGLTGLPVEAYEDKTVFESARRMEADTYTVVNRYDNPHDAAKPIYVKVQCMHCLKPACASACLVGALRRTGQGAVTYDPWKCMGCRYCMVACPFQVPAYEYGKAFTPVVSKCNFCYERVVQEGRIPACAEMCPPNCLTFAKRGRLLELAREKIAASPQRYHAEIYGENEVGGTAWMYVTSRPVTELGLLELGSRPVTELPEMVQHNVFKGGLPPLLLLGLLGAAMRTFRREEKTGDDATTRGVRKGEE